MPIYMVQHITKNITTINLAVAFYLKLKNKFHKKCINCWIDYKKNSVFYLIKIINKEAIKQLYLKSFNLIPHKITAVNNNLVYAFLNNQQRIKSIQPESIIPHNHTIFLIIKIQNFKLQEIKFGQKKFNRTLINTKSIINNYLNSYGGTQINVSRNEIVLLFTSYEKAINYSYLILK